MVDEARSGSEVGIVLAAHCELALRGVTHPSREQMAGAVLHAWHCEDIRIMAHGKTWKE